MNYTKDGNSISFNTIYNTDCFEILKNIKDNSIDFICTDPPYKDNNGTNKLNHKIQTSFDINLLMSEFYRILKHNNFLAFFGQMPLIVDWYLAAIQNNFKFKKDIIWNKINANMQSKNQLGNSHELIYIFTKGEKSFVNVSGDYDYVTAANINGNIQTTAGLIRKMGYLKAKVNGVEQKTNRNSVNGNDDIYNRDCKYNYNNQFITNKSNYKTIWSFLPHNKEHRNPLNGQIKHPTVKSIDLMERLLDLCSKENDIILDPFLGSGTTAIAAVNTNRQIIGCEIFEDYFELIKTRLNKLNTNLF